MFMILYFVGDSLKRSRLRTVRRINEKHFTSFDARGGAKTKFKKGKGR